jgi:hypothetical protein
MHSFMDAFRNVLTLHGLIRLRREGIPCCSR